MNGRHLGFPLRLDGRGRTALATEEEYLCGLVEAVLFTRPGERVNRPGFGSGVHALVFAPSGDELAQTTQALVQGSLQHWLGDLLRVEEVRVAAVESRLTVTITYTPLVSGAARRTVTVARTAGGSP
jgi:Bacteriophage baseplate protein W